MPTFNYKGRHVFYEIEGNGEPILLLNGIMMSTKSWEPFVHTFTHQNQLIRLDFFDQGQSELLTNSVYDISLQADLVEACLAHLNIKKINVVGISYGGEVALQFASKYPHRVRRLVLFNTTPYTSPWLAEIGHKWNAIGKLRDGKTYYQATIPIIYSPSYYETHLDWMKKRESILVPIFSTPEFLDKIERLTDSAEHFDIRDQVHNINMPVLIVAADEDYLTPIQNQKALHALLPKSELVILPGVGHASMYEKPLLFASLVLGFINTVDETYHI
ncbi:MAG: alpha/beta fold hydrolase [Acholeplasmataceae bacterium]